MEMGIIHLASHMDPITTPHMYICEPRKLLQGCANAHGRVGLLLSLGVTRG